MAKHRVFLYIGPDPVEITPELRAHLAQAQILTPDVGQGDLDRADLEIRRAHKSADLRRRDVEGSWANVGRRAFKLRSDAFISQPRFHLAEADQAALAVDGLMGMRVHLLTSGPRLPLAWVGLAKPHRVHVACGPLADEVTAIARREREARARRGRRRLVA